MAILLNLVKNLCGHMFNLIALSHPQLRVQLLPNRPLNTLSLLDISMVNSRGD